MRPSPSLLAPPSSSSSREVLFYRTPRLYPSNVVHTLAIASHFAREAQRAAVDRAKRQGEKKPAPGVEGLRWISVVREPVQSHIINTGHVAFTDRGLAAKVLQSDTMDQVHFAARVPTEVDDDGSSKKGSRKRRGKPYASLCDVAPFIGLELPKGWSSPSAVPATGGSAAMQSEQEGTPREDNSRYEDQWFQMTAYPSAPSHARSGPDGEGRATTTAGGKKLNEQAMRDREAIRRFPGLSKLLQREREKRAEVKDPFLEGTRWEREGRR